MIKWNSLKGVRAIGSATNSLFGLLEGTGCVYLYETGSRNTSPGRYMVQEIGLPLTQWNNLHGHGCTFFRVVTASGTHSAGAWEGISHEAHATETASIACHMPLAKNTPKCPLRYYLDLWKCSVSQIQGFTSPCNPFCCQIFWRHCGKGEV